jgi:hypothetical protein
VAHMVWRDTCLAPVVAGFVSLTNTKRGTFRMSGGTAHSAEAESRLRSFVIMVLT